MKKPTIITELTNYEYPVYNNIEIVSHNVNIIVKHLLLLVPKIERIQLFCRGTSGLTISTYLCKVMKENGYPNAEIAFIRKPGESSHGSTTRPKFGYKTIIVDDFVGSGATMIEIINTIKSYDVLDNLSFIIGITCQFATKIEEEFKRLKGLQFVIQ